MVSTKFHESIADIEWETLGKKPFLRKMRKLLLDEIENKIAKRNRYAATYHEREVARAKTVDDFRAVADHVKASIKFFDEEEEKRQIAKDIEERFSQAITDKLGGRLVGASGWNSSYYLMPSGHKLRMANHVHPYGNDEHYQVYIPQSSGADPFVSKVLGPNLKMHVWILDATPDWKQRVDSVIEEISELEKRAGHG